MDHGEAHHSRLVLVPWSSVRSRSLYCASGRGRPVAMAGRRISGMGGERPGALLARRAPSL